MKCKIFCVLFFISMACISIRVNGQDISESEADTKRQEYHAGLGVGGSYFGLTFNFNLSYSFGANVFSARYLTADEMQWGNPGGGGKETPAVQLREFGILYGRQSRVQHFVISISGGAGYIKAMDRGGLIRGKEFQEISITGFCVPLEAKVRYELKNNAAIGFGLISNINSKQSILGWQFELSYRFEY